MSRIFVVITILFLSMSSLSAQSISDDEIKKVSAELTKAYSAKNYDEALIAANKIVELSVAKFGKQDLATAKALKNRGFVEAAKGDAKSAENSLEDAADIFRKQTTLSKADAGNFAELLESLAGLKMKRDLLLGEGLLKEAIEQREKSEPNSASMGFALASLANINFWKRDYKKSAEQYDRALQTYSASKTTDLPDFTTAFYRARCTYRKAKMDAEFEALKTAHGFKAEFFGGKPAPGKARLINGGVINGKALNLAQPRYPAEARQANAEGTVDVEVLLGENGEVISACTSKAQHTSLAEAAEIAADNSKFAPTTLQGNPVKVTG
ncbi:MAG: TonB family protein, partial [Acidobacteria bacterium]|nr:TonB family protein [Acidobacteriota bacterium]